MQLVPEVNCLAHLENALSVEKYQAPVGGPERSVGDMHEEPGVGAVRGGPGPRGRVGVQVALLPHGRAMSRTRWATARSAPSASSRTAASRSSSPSTTRHMAAFIKSLGKRPMMWGDMLLENRGAAEAMPKDIIIFDWHYGETTVDTVKYFTSQGFDVFVCPAMSGFGRLAAPYAHATGNIYKFIGEGKEGGAIGECTCAWELRLGHLFTNDYFGILLSADRSWNVGAGDLADYEKRFCKAFFGLDDLRPVQYYRELSDGYASIFEPAVPRSSWMAFSDKLRDRVRELRRRRNARDAGQVRRATREAHIYAR